jgi:hypothetical protein
MSRFNDTAYSFSREMRHAHEGERDATIQVCGGGVRRGCHAEHWRRHVTRQHPSAPAREVTFKVSEDLMHQQRRIIRLED